MRRQFLFAAVAAIATQAGAQISFPVMPPDPKVGDIAVYRQVDLWSNRETAVIDVVLAAIEPERFIVQLRETPPGTDRTVRLTREWNFCRRMRDAADQPPTCGGPLKFPMTQGAKHSYELPLPNGQIFLDATCTVRGQEKVTVTAGTIDAVVIECRGYWNRRFGGVGSGRMEEKVWYAPAIHRTVKSLYTTYHAGAGGVDVKSMTELVGFTPGR